MMIIISEIIGDQVSGYTLVEIKYLVMANLENLVVQAIAGILSVIPSIHW